MMLRVDRIDATGDDWIRQAIVVATPHLWRMRATYDPQLMVNKNLRIAAGSNFQLVCTLRNSAALFQESRDNDAALQGGYRMLQEKLTAVTHGSSGFVLSYVAVVIPTAVGLLRGRAPASKLLLSPVLAIPVTAVAAIAVALASPLLRSLRIASGSVLSLGFGVAACAAIGYASGREVEFVGRDHQRL